MKNHLYRLCWMLLCVLGLILLTIGDRRNSSGKRSSGETYGSIVIEETDNLKENPQNKETENPGEAKGEKQTRVKEGDQKGTHTKVVNTLFLAVGTTGNLKEKSGEPVYAFPSEEADRIATLQYNCAVVITDDAYAEGWTEVELYSRKGYVRNSGYQAVRISYGDTTNSPARNGIIKDAVSYLGIPFKRYGTSLENGIDCSNYIQQIYELNGIQIKKTPNGMKEDAIIISDKEALPGDIVYYYANAGEGHVGIYLGEDQDGTQYIINTAGHAGKTYPEGGCRICRIRYYDREEYVICRLF